MPNACLDCTDNRFEIIADYKKRLIESTNIESSPDEMAVIDSVLYRIWQMGWIPAADVELVKHGRWGKARRRGCVSYADGYAECSECHGKPTFGGWDMKYCPNCGAKMDAEPPKGEQNG